TLLRIGQYVVGLGEVFELLLRGFVAGIEIGVVSARKTAIRLANFFLSRGALNTECFVVIFALSHKKRRGEGAAGRRAVGGQGDGGAWRHFKLLSLSQSPPPPFSPPAALLPVSYFTP